MEVIIMLVLTRKCNEVVVVGGANGLETLLKVTVLGIENGKVRLGFEAAEDVPVHRLEVWERIRAFAQIEAPTKKEIDATDWASKLPSALHQ
jgi:carbon storage regulator CsrA